jgi:predicted dehydrogenase
MNVAIVGAGLMGRWHADAAVRCGATVRWIVDRDSSRATALASKVGGQPIAALDAALQSGSTDLVHICTPLETHVPLTKQALAAGAHAIVEKPLAPSSAETKDLIDLAIRSGRVLAPVHQFLFQRGVRELRRIIPESEVIGVRSLACSAASNSTTIDPDDVALEILPHHLAIAAEITGRRMAAIPWSVFRSAPGELHAAAGCDGVQLSIIISLQARPTRNELHVLGRSASGYADLYHGYAWVDQRPTSQYQKVWHPFGRSLSELFVASSNLMRRAVGRESAYPGLRRLIDATYRASHLASDWPISPERIIDEADARAAIAGHFRKL